MKSIKKHIPNTLTCCNFLCGSLATIITCFGLGKYAHYPAIRPDEVLNLLTPFYINAFGLIILGAVFDFFDGFSARLLKVSSPIGKELDSLADAVTFGLAPTTIVFSAAYISTDYNRLTLIALLMAAFSILRLAKFNLDERQTTSFIGLATPANALFWGSTICTYSAFAEHFSNLSIIGWVIVGMTFVSCYLLVSEIPFFSLKFHDFKWETNKIRFIFLIGAVILVCISLIIAVIYNKFTFIVTAFSAIILYYIFLSLVDNLTHKH